MGYDYIILYAMHLKGNKMFQTVYFVWLYQIKWSKCFDLKTGDKIVSLDIGYHLPFSNMIDLSLYNRILAVYKIIDLVLCYTVFSLYKAIGFLSLGKRILNYNNIRIWNLFLTVTSLWL